MSSTTTDSPNNGDEKLAGPRTWIWTIVFVSTGVICFGFTFWLVCYLRRKYGWCGRKRYRNDVDEDDDSRTNIRGRLKTQQQT